MLIIKMARKGELMDELSLWQRLMIFIDKITKETKLE